MREYENVPNLIVVRVACIREYSCTKDNRLVYFKSINYIIYDYHNKSIIKKVCVQTAYGPRV